MLNLDPFRLRFPLDVEVNIIDQLADCVPALRYCALTCRAWRNRSRFHLLHSVCIKTVQQLEALSHMLNSNKYPYRHSSIESVTMAPVAREPNPRNLLEAFPHELLANTQNLRRWEINQGVMRRASSMDILSFREPTLGERLRGSSIKELHLCSVRLESHSGLLRLLIASAQLDSLRCVAVAFAREEPDLDSLKTEARRCLVNLSTLTVSIARLRIRVAFRIAWRQRRKLTAAIRWRVWR